MYVGITDYTEKDTIWSPNIKAFSTKSYWAVVGQSR